MKRAAALSPEMAETLALRALAYLASSEEDLERFMSLTGLDAAQLKQGASDPAFLAGILDYYLNHEPSLLAMCDALELDPMAPARARHVLQADTGMESF